MIISLPLSSLLVVFGLFFLVFLAFFFMSVRSIILSRAVDLSTVTITLVVVLATAWILGAGALALRDIDWRSPLFTIDFSNSGFTPTSPSFE